MKRTSVSTLISSPDTSRHRVFGAPLRRVVMAVAFLAMSGLMFMAGRGTAPLPGDYAEQLQALRLMLHKQQGQVDRLRRDNRQDVNALAARLAELQAASTRLDALVERLAQMGQLSLDEFDFSAPAPVGGPADYDSLGAAGEQELRRSIAALGEKLRRQSTQLDALQMLMVNRQLESDLTPAGWPVRKGWISSRFGERNDPFTGERVQHRGLDFAGTKGTEVLSVANGVVIWAAGRTGYGKTVEIDHGNGYRTRYAHNQLLSVQPGQHVKAGQVIARMGSSGRASAPHVHFEVLKDGVRINPSKFVSHLR
jgi:murein DD-endopeptidase MepM/ murein hydrolase activator NlpD